MEVGRGRVVDEERPHRRGHQVELVHGRHTENLLDGAGHVDLRVEGAVFGDTGAVPSGSPAA